MGDYGDAGAYKICVKAAKILPESIFYEDNKGKTFLEYISNKRMKTKCLKLAKEKLVEKLPEKLTLKVCAFLPSSSDEST